MPCRMPTGAPSSHKNPLRCKDIPPDPADQARGRSRGGLSTKVHLAVAGRGLPLTVRLTGGQAGDNPQLLPLRCTCLSGDRVGPAPKSGT